MRMRVLRIAVNPPRPFYSQTCRSSRPSSPPPKKARTITALGVPGPQLVLVIVYELGSLFAFLMYT